MPQGRPRPNASCESGSRRAVRRSSSATARPRASPLPAPRRRAADLDSTLVSRRTVREFGRRPVSLADFSAVVGGTFGRTGSHDAGPFGRLMTKTSPSAGSLHPIECYVLVWNVRGARSRPLPFRRRRGRPAPAAPRPLPGAGGARRVGPDLGRPRGVSLHHDRRRRAQPLEVPGRGDLPNALSGRGPPRPDLLPARDLAGSRAVHDRGHSGHVTSRGFSVSTARASFRSTCVEQVSRRSEGASPKAAPPSCGSGSSPRTARFVRRVSALFDGSCRWPLPVGSRFVEGRDPGSTRTGLGRSGGAPACIASSFAMSVRNRGPAFPPGRCTKP